MWQTAAPKHVLFLPPSFFFFISHTNRHTNPLLRALMFEFIPLSISISISHSPRNCSPSTVTRGLRYTRTHTNTETQIHFTAGEQTISVDFTGMSEALTPPRSVYWFCCLILMSLASSITAPLVALGEPGWRGGLNKGETGTITLPLGIYQWEFPEYHFWDASTLIKKKPGRTSVWDMWCDGSE